MYNFVQPIFITFFVASYPYSGVLGSEKLTFEGKGAHIDEEHKTELMYPKAESFRNQTIAQFPPPEVVPAIIENSSKESIVAAGKNLEKSSGPHLSTRALSQAFQPVRRIYSSMYAYARDLLYNSLKSTIGQPSVDRVRYLLGNTYLRPILRKMVADPKVPVPDNFHDDADGIFLRLLMGHDQGPTILQLIELILKHVKVIKENGKDKYKINIIYLVYGVRRILKKMEVKDSLSHDGGEGKTQASATSAGTAQPQRGADGAEPGGGVAEQGVLSTQRSNSDAANSGGAKIGVANLGGANSGEANSGSAKINGSNSGVTQQMNSGNKRQGPKFMRLFGKKCLKKSIRTVQKFVKIKKPQGFRDNAGGLLLRLAMMNPEAPLYLNTIKAVVNNVRVVREPGKKPQYHIDFLGIAASPGISPLMSDIPGLPGELLRGLSIKGRVPTQGQR